MNRGLGRAGRPGHRAVARTGAVCARGPGARALLFTVCASLGAISFAPAARADTVLLLPVGGHAQIADRDRDRATRALSAVLREQDGTRVIEWRAAVERLPPRLRTCIEGECVLEAMRAVGADAAYGLALWRDRGGQTRVALSLTAGASTVEAEASGEDIVAAVRAALEQVRARLAGGQGPWLLVQGSPLGATVLLDGERVGVLPWRGRASAGLHHVVVRMDGYAESHHTVRVPADPASQTTVEVRLTEAGTGTAVATSAADAPGPRARQREGAGAASGGPGVSVGGQAGHEEGADARSGRGLLGWVGPIGLGVAGVGAMAYATWAATRPEQCTGTGPAARCERTSGLSVGLFYGAGALAIAGAVVWWLAAEPGSDAQAGGAVGARGLPAVEGRWVADLVVGVEPHAISAGLRWTGTVW